MNQNYNPLVSIIVVTYNSAKYVLETLESAKAQTYHNIELIVTDDCSTDNTTKLCEKWLEENKNRFIRSKLILSHQNTGIAPNCNRGLKETQGEWVKYIAGDDILTEECIVKFVDYVNNNPEAKFLFGAIVPFYNQTIYRALMAPKDVFSASAKKQHKLLLQKGCFVPAAGNFMKRDIVYTLGGFDERFPMCEDYPLWLKVTKLNHKLYFYNFNCVRYRIHQDSLTNSAFIINEVNPIFLQTFWDIRLSLVMPLLLKNKLYFTYIHFKTLNWRNNKKGGGLNRAKRYLSYFFDPLGIYIKVMRIMHIQDKYGFKFIRET